MFPLRSLHLILLSLVAQSTIGWVILRDTSATITIPSTCGTSLPQITAPFVSYAVEFNSFHNFTGDDTTGPNTLSQNMISHLGAISGTNPYWRVGGNSADLASYDPNLPTDVATQGPDSQGQIDTIVGPTFFQGFKQWTGVKYIFDFNLRQQPQDNNNANLDDMVAAACQAIGTNSYLWEYGNEPDLYDTKTPTPARPSPYTPSEFVAQWTSGVAVIQNAMQSACPELPTPSFMTPSIGAYNPNAVLNPVDVAQDGILSSSVKEWTLHDYQGSTTTGTMNTLMTHDGISEAVNSRGNLLKQMKAVNSNNLPGTLTEVNDLVNVGLPGVSDRFGAALWAMDYQLFAASTGNIQRVHMQQGFGFPYNSWQPIDAQNPNISPQISEPKGPRPHYYGDIAATSALGECTNNNCQITYVSIGQDTDHEVGYAIYSGGTLARLALINLNQQASSSSTRPRISYTFNIGSGHNTAGTAQWLNATGSDAFGQVTYNGNNYNVDGNPQTLANRPANVPVPISNGEFTIEVPASSAVVIQF